MLKLRKTGRCAIAVAVASVFVAGTSLIVRSLSTVIETFAAGNYTAYEFQDWIYYDPVSGSANCNSSNYWTIWDQSMTCYRFFMVDRDDDESRSEVRLILDHDVAVDTFDNINNVLNNVRTTWRDYSGVLAVMSEDAIASAMQLSSRPTLDNISVGDRIERFLTNTMYYDNGALVDSGGWWSSDLYPSDNSYAYTITEYGKNRLAKTTARRGIRPMIVLDKSKVTGVGEEIKNITNIVNKENNRYLYKSISYGGDVYNQLQGFTMTNNGLVFYSMINGGEDLYGLLSGYTGGNYSNAIAGSPFYIEGGHGNDMAYDSKNKKVLLVGPNDYGSVFIYDAETLAYSGEEIISDRTEWPTSFSTIAYDDVNDYYISNVNGGRRACIMNDDFGMLYSFDVPHDETGQGFGYHNGYLYQTSCKNCARVTGKSFINVYNMKFNSDGVPGRGFGRRVARLVIDGTAGLGEIESISFHDDDAFLGFSVVGDANNNVFQFRHFDYGDIASNWPVDVKYADLNNGIVITITAEDQLEGVAGYTLMDDGYSMSKTVYAESVSESIDVCDHYNNCTRVNVSHTNESYLPAQVVSFASGDISKTYGDANFRNVATTNGNGVIGYVSNNTRVAEVDSVTGEVSIKGAGVAKITATANATGTYSESSASYTLTIAKAASKMPSEFNDVLVGVVGEPLSSIVFETLGASWVNGGTIIELGENQYSAFYVQNGEDSNYTTETFSVTVKGVARRYEVIEGNGQLYTIGESEVLYFRINADYDLFENDGQIYIDEKLVDSDNYRVSSGSTIINIKKSYADKLSVGKHSLTVTFGEDGVAEAEFEIKNKSSSGSKEPSGSDKNDSDDVLPVPNTSGKAPNTGSNIEDGNGGIVVLCALPIIIFGMVVVFRKYLGSKKQNKFRL